MWISKKKWKEINSRIEKCEKSIQQQKQITDKKITEMAKKILRQPGKLSKEIDMDENIERFVDDFIRCQ